MAKWTNILAAGSGTWTECFRNPRDYVVIGFDAGVPIYDWPYVLSVEPAFPPVAGGGTYTDPYYKALRAGADRRFSMKGATKLLFDNTTYSGGILVMMKPDQKITCKGTGLSGGTLTYTLPPDCILFDNEYWTGSAWARKGYMTSGVSGSDPATCPKVFKCTGRTQVSIPLGSGANAGLVSTCFTSASKWVVCKFGTGVTKSTLKKLGFLSADGFVNFRFALIPTGRNGAQINGFRSDAGSIMTVPPNTLSFGVNNSWTADKLPIMEYSGPDGWKPLSILDGTNGFRGNGPIHFEPPYDWTASSRWDDKFDIGGGPPGTGRRAYWIRIQRRNMDRSITPPQLTIYAYNRPYVIAKRVDDPLYLDFEKADKGKTVSFRFVPLDKRGNAHLSRAIYFDHLIKGMCFG